MTNFELHSKTIVVSGASSGIGRACCHLLSQAGAKIIMIGRDEDRLQQTYGSLEGSGHHVQVLDLVKFKEVEGFAKEWITSNGPVDGIVNAAGIASTVPFKYAKPKKLEEVFQVNVNGAIQLTRNFTHKVKDTGMSIIFISSVMASVGESAKSLYSISKGALLAGVKSLSVELASKNVRVNAVSPAVVETPMINDAAYKRSREAYEEILKKHPLGIGKPEDVANACLFLLSDASRWITGIDLKVDGGYTAQ